MTAALKADLGEQISKKHALVVVGTGVSLASTGGETVASWKGLIANGIRRCVDRGFCEPTWADVQNVLLEGDLDDLLGVAEQVSRRLGWEPTEPCRGDWNKWLRETVGALKATDANLIEAIRDLGVPIATLNYDNLLTDVTNRPPVTWKRAESWLPVLHGEDQAIMHLHGHWREPSSVVLGIRSYDAVIGQALPQHLQQVIASLHSLVFIGCSGTVQDPNFSALIEWMRQQLRGAEHSHYLLLREGETLPVEESRLREARIVPLRYGASHADLVPFIRRLARKPSGRRRSGEDPPAGGGAEPSKTAKPERATTQVGDDTPPIEAPDGDGDALCEAQEEKATDALRRSPQLFRALQNRRRFNKFRPDEPVPADEETMVRAIARCRAERAEPAIAFVRKALNSLADELDGQSERHNAEKAAVDLFCLAVVRLLNNGDQNGVLARRREGDLVVSVPTDANIVCAVIAMTILDLELELIPGSSERLPDGKYVFDVEAPISSDQFEEDFIRRV